MVSSFKDFISSRENKNQSFATPNSPQVSMRSYIDSQRQDKKRSEDIYQPDPNQPSFQESDEGRLYRDELKRIQQSAAAVHPMNRDGFLRKEEDNARKTFKGSYDARIKQGKVFEGADFTAMGGNVYDKDKDSPASFILADRNQYVAKQQAGQANLSENLKAGDQEIESYYYQQLLQKNNISTMSVTPLKPDGSVNWEEKIVQYQKQTYDLLKPIAIAGQYTNVTGYQKRALEKETGISRLGTFAGRVSNPLNEEFLPVASAQALGALPGFAAKELGVATPAVADNLMKVGATAGEWVGFGVGVGSVGRSARWVAEDIALPFLAVRGTKRLVAKKFGQKGIRTAAQLDNLISHADQVPPSVEPTELQLLETNTSPLVFARSSVGGTGSIADSVRMSANADGLLDRVTVVKNNATTTYEINTADDWFNAAGDATGMSKESVEQAKRISRPVLEALADFYDVPVDQYVRGMSPQVRSVLGDGTFAGRTTPGGLPASLGPSRMELDAGYTVMQSQFRKIASLVEFVKKTPGLGTNQADSLITLQHELAHVILEDIFEYSRVLGRTNDTKLADLSRTLKEQVIRKGQVSEGAIGRQQISLLNSLSVEEVGMLLNGRTPGRYLQTISEGGKNAELLISDLTTLLHEAGADLFAKYTMDMVTGARRGSVSSKILGGSGTLEGHSMWWSAANSLTESWKILRGAVNPQGIAQPSGFAEEKVVDNFVRILEDITKSKGTFTGEGRRIQEARDAFEIQRMEQLPAAQVRVLQRAHLAQTVDPTDPHMMPLAEAVFGGKWNYKQNHGSKVQFDLSDAQDLMTGTTAKYTPLAKQIIFHPQYEPVLHRVLTGEGVDGYGQFQDIDRLRAAVALTATSPETRVSVLHDIVSQVRDRLEFVDPNIPNLEKRLAESAFVNEAGQPIVFYHGAAVDFDKNFKHVETKVFTNLLGPGLYTTDWDQAAFTYAIDAFTPWGPAAPNPRIQAFQILVPKERVMSLEMVGLGDPVGSRFIDGVYNTLEHTTARKQQLRVQAARLDVILAGDFLASAERAKKGLVPSVEAELLRIAGARESTTGVVSRFRILGRELLNSVSSLDLTVTDISKLFGESALRKSHDKFAEAIEKSLIRQQGPYFEGSFRDALSDSAMGDFELEEDLFKRVVAEASVVASKAQVEEELAGLASRGIAPTKEQLQGLKNLEAQEKVTRQAINVIEAVVQGGERQLIREAMGYDIFDQLEGFNEVLQGKLTSPYTWQMAKSLSLNNLTEVPLDMTNGSEFATWHLYNKRNRQFIQDIQDTYSSQVNKVRDIDENLVAEKTTQAKALKQLNAHYAEYNIEALTEIGGASQGAVPHRVAVLVGSDEVIQSNRAFVKVKTKGQGSLDPAAREPSSEEARSFYRKLNPKGGDIDETIVQGELESAATKFGRNIEEGLSSLEDLGNKAVQAAMDKKLVASPRAVEGPARAGAEILDLQRKAEQGLVISSYHGIPRKIASNLTPPQLDYIKYFGKGISDPVNKDVLDFVMTDTTGNFRTLDGRMTPEGESLIADRLIPEIQKRLDSEEYKTFRKQRDADIATARTKGTKMILDAEEAAKLPKSDPAYISGVEKERRINLGKKLTKSEPGGFKPLKIHPLEVQALLNTGFERLKDIPASEGQAKLIRAFDRDGYATAIKKLIGVETPYVGSIADLEIAAAAPRLKGMAGTKALSTAEVLAPHEVQFIWEALGLKTKDRSITPQTKLQMLRDIFTQIFNLPRTLLLSVDLGAIWNQGGMLIGGAVKPITTKRSLQHLANGNFNAWYKGPDTLFYRNLGNAMTGMASSGNYRSQMDALTKDVNYTYLTQKTNIHISDIDGPLSNREEAFLGNIFNSVGNVLPETVRKNPFMQRVAKVAGKASFVGYPFKAGERFHTLYLNKMRYEMLNDFNKGLVTSGIPEGKRVEALNSYADFLNKATGRGSLGKLDDLAPELSTILLAPRWMASRFQVPYSVAKTFGKESLDAIPKRFTKGTDAAAALKDAKAHAKKLGLQPTDVVESGDYFTVQGYKGAHTSKQMSQDLVRTFGVIGGIAGLLAMNGFEVETDWRKSSFLKINKGRINLDLTMGLGSVWRFVARAGYGVTGDRKEVSGSGIEFEADVMRQIGNFTRAKLSPLGASAAGIITGTNYYGEEVSGPSTFVPGQTTDYEDFLPLMVQQIKDASEQMDGGFTQILLGAGAVSGLNVGIYPDKDDIAMELAGIPYKDLYGYEQKYINRMYYEGTEFVPSEYTQQTSKLEDDQYEFVETIMAGNIPNGQKASRIYRYMNDQDLMLHGLRLAYFGEDRNSEEQLDPLKQAQNEYYELLGELNTPEQQALLTDEQLEIIKDKFLKTLTAKEKDYILANKSNFMVPPSIGNLIKPNYAAEAKREERNSRTRSALKAKGLAVPDAIKAPSVNNASDKYYAIAKSVMESNAARDRLSSGRTAIPSAEEQIELTRSILTR
jgi:hypothetical protein